MKPAQLGTLKFFALLFLLPGLAGLIVSAMISTHYLDTMPRGPVLVESRVVPREIHGIVVYQTRRRQETEHDRVLVGGVFVSVSFWVLCTWKSGELLRLATAKRMTSLRKIAPSSSSWPSCQYAPSFISYN